MAVTIFIRLVSALLILSVSTNVDGACADNIGGWAKPLYEFLNARLVLLQKANNFNQNRTEAELLEVFIDELRTLPEKAEQLLQAPLSNPEVKNDCFDMIVNLRSKKWSELFLLVNSNALPGNDDNRGSVIDSSINTKIQEHLNSGNQTSGYVLPLEEMCAGIHEPHFQKEITIADLCPDVQSCATERKPYGKDALGKSFTDVCTSEQKCDLDLAFPRMAGVFWYKLSDWMVERMCPKKCSSGECNYEETYKKVLHEAKLLQAFGNILPSYWTSSWKSFFKTAVDNKAYLDLNQALEMVYDKEKVLDTTPVACNELLFTEACPYADIYKEYILIKKIQKYRQEPGLVRDLRKLPNIDFKTRLEQEKNTVRHIELLGAVNAVNENLEVSVSGISQYFQGLARYDEAIAKADVDFLNAELDKYETNLAKVETQIKGDVHEIMKKMVVVVVANLGEAVALLAAKIVENSNPLKLIFSGPDLAEVIEATGNVADATTEVVKGAALIIALNGLAEDSLKIAEAFLGNKGQIEGIKEVVDKIRQNQTDDIGKDADTFIAAYTGYTPQTDRSQLEKNNALWSAFKDATCDILSGEVGIAGATAKGIVGGKLLCEKLEGTLAQFFTLREDIFDFQFQLVDAVAQVVRGNIAKRFAQGIKGKGDVIHASQLLIGSFKMHARFQTTASIFCDILEYQRRGEPSRTACATVNGLFTKENLDALIEHSFNAPMNELDRDVYIPTRARFAGDTGYIDLVALGRGETVVFKPSADRSRLLGDEWILSSHRDMPFISSFELYLPHKEYKTGADRQRTTTAITIASIAGSHVSTQPSKIKVSYILPRGHSTFQTVYEEGYTTCSSTEIDNPYSLCDNLPKICDMSTRHAGKSLLPTVLSTWSLKYTIHQGSTELIWDAPQPETNLHIRAKIKLRIPQSGVKKSILPNIIQRSEVVASENGCCDGNMVRSNRHNNNCESCPENSISHLRGYYCEIPDETE